MKKQPPPSQLYQNPEDDDDLLDDLEHSGSFVVEDQSQQPHQNHKDPPALPMLRLAGHRLGVVMTVSSFWRLMLLLLPLFLWSYCTTNLNNSNSIGRSRVPTFFAVPHQSLGGASSFLWWPWQSRSNERHNWSKEQQQQQQQQQQQGDGKLIPSHEQEQQQQDPQYQQQYQHQPQQPQHQHQQYPYEQQYLTAEWDAAVAQMQRDQASLFYHLALEAFGPAPHRIQMHLILKSQHEQSQQQPASEQQPTNLQQPSMRTFKDETTNELDKNPSPSNKKDSSLSFVNRSFERRSSSSSLFHSPAPADSDPKKLMEDGMVTDQQRQQHQHGENYGNKTTTATANITQAITLTLELAPLSALPVTLYYVLQQIQRGLWNRASFYAKTRHWIMAHPVAIASQQDDDHGIEDDDSDDDYDDDDNDKNDGCYQNWRTMQMLGLARLPFAETGTSTLLLHRQDNSGHNKKNTNHNDADDSSSSSTLQEWWHASSTGNSGATQSNEKNDESDSAGTMLRLSLGGHPLLPGPTWLIHKTKASTVPSTETRAGDSTTTTTHSQRSQVRPPMNPYFARILPNSAAADFLEWIMMVNDRKEDQHVDAWRNVEIQWVRLLEDGKEGDDASQEEGAH